MVSLTFEFNEEVLKACNITEDELLLEVREFSKEKGITESEFGVFTKDSENALCVILMIITDIIEENIKYVDYLKRLELDVDGEKEDCIESVKKWFKRNR